MWRYQADKPLRTLLHLYRQDYKNLILSLVFYVIKHSPEWLRPVIIANIIDIISLPSRHSLGKLWLNGIVLLVSVIQNIPTHYLHIRYMSRATRGLEKNLRSAIAEQLQKLSMSFLYRSNSGVIQAKLLRDIDNIHLLTSQLWQFLPSTILTIAIALTITGLRAPGFLLFFLATIPLAVILVKSLNTPLKQRNHILREQFEQVSAHLMTMVRLIPVTRAHGLEEVELDKTRNKLAKLEQAGLKVDSINAIANASSWVILRLFSGLCLITAAVFAYRGQFEVTVGTVVLLTGYFEAITNSTVQILTVLPQLSKGLEAIRSVGEILECRELEPNEGKQEVTQVIGAFCFEKVSFLYPGTNQASVEDFSLKVSEGETIAIAGPSGAGKSTLLNLIIGFLRPTSGRILLDGRNFQDLDLRSYRRFLAVVSQDTILFAGTVRENILYGIDNCSEEQLLNALEQSNSLEFISHLPQGLETMIGENGVKLSGGQRQRLAIARALIRDPRVLILDEATSALDSASESLIQTTLNHLMTKRTTFVVAHRLSTIRQADRIVVLAKGRIVEIGSYRELLAQKGLFSRLHYLQTSPIN